METKKISGFKINQIVKTVAELHYKQYCSPATIGHILKSKHNIVIKNLCKIFPFLNEDEFQAHRLSLLNSKRKLHLQNNHKDIPPRRKLVQSELKLKLLNQKIKAKN